MLCPLQIEFRNWVLSLTIKTISSDAESWGLEVKIADSK
jgi:hypothetical protein